MTEQECMIASSFGLDFKVHTDDYHYKVNIPNKYYNNVELIHNVFNLMGCDDEECKKIYASLTCCNDHAIVVHHNATFDSLNGTSMIENIIISWDPILFPNKSHANRCLCALPTF